MYTAGGKNTIYAKEVKIKNKKVDNGLNEDFIEIISSNSGKMAPFMKLSWKQQNVCSLSLLLRLVIIPLFALPCRFFIKLQLKFSKLLVLTTQTSETVTYYQVFDCLNVIKKFGKYIKRKPNNF